MPRVGVSPDQQSSGGSFRFAEGRGIVTNCVIGNHTIPGFPTNCGYYITIQRLGTDGKPTNDEPLTEFLGCGSVEVFHPGLAAGRDDKDEQLEIGGQKDLGPNDGVEGNCVLSIGRGPDRQAKISLFTNSCIEQGVKKEVFADGWAGALIGLDAWFTQKMTKKPANSTAKEDPTCLIVGRGGKEVPATAEKLVYKYPDGTGVSVLNSGGAATTTSDRPRPTPPASQPVNGAPAPVVTMPGPGQNQTATPTGPVAVDPFAGESDEAIAMTILGGYGESLAGQTKTVASLKTKLLVELNSRKVPAVRHKAVKAYVSNPEWFKTQAEAFEWVMTPTGEVKFPATV